MQSESAPSGDRRECRLKYDAASNRLWCGEHCCYSEDCPKPEQSGRRGASQPVDEDGWMRDALEQLTNARWPERRGCPLDWDERVQEMTDTLTRAMSTGQTARAEAAEAEKLRQTANANEFQRKWEAAEADRDRLQRRVERLEGALKGLNWNAECELCPPCAQRVKAAFAALSSAAER